MWQEEFNDLELILIALQVVIQANLSYRKRDVSYEDHFVSRPNGIKFKNENFINTNKIVNEVISLPIHTELTYSQIEFICEKVINFLDK